MAAPFFSRPARAAGGSGRGGQFASSGGGALRGQPVGGGEASAARAGDRLNGAGQDRRSPPRQACRAPGVALRADRGAQGDHAAGDASVACCWARGHGVGVGDLDEAAQARAAPQKKSLKAAEQDRPDVARRRRRWQLWQRFMDASAFVFLDETGAATNMTRLSGWGPKGERLVDAAPQRPAWSLAHHPLHRRPAQQRQRRPARARWPNDRRVVPRPCRAEARAHPQARRRSGDEQSRGPQGRRRRGGGARGGRRHPYTSRPTHLTSTRSSRCSPS